MNRRARTNRRSAADPCPSVIRGKIRIQRDSQDDSGQILLIVLILFCRELKVPRSLDQGNSSPFPPFLEHSSALAFLCLAIFKANAGVNAAVPKALCLPNLKVSLNV